jgi:16S rRNA (guanine527-N7)-methyltransferase
MSQFTELLSTRLKGIMEASPAQLGRLEQHFELLLRWNDKLNLTRITGLDEAVTRHYAESAFIAAHLPAQDGLRIADIGSGAGFPGLPIAVLRPELRVDLVESRSRKAAFLREATADLSNCRVLAERAERIRGPYDWLVSRAVAPKEILSLRIGDSRAMLVGPEAAGKLPGERIPLPWPESGYLILVPRGT